MKLNKYLDSISVGCVCLDKFLFFNKIAFTKLSFVGMPPACLLLVFMDEIYCGSCLSYHSATFRKPQGRRFLQDLQFKEELWLSWTNDPFLFYRLCKSHEHLIAKFRLKLKKVGKTTIPFRYDLNQIPYDYTVEVRNRFKGLDLIEYLMNYGRRGSWHCTGDRDQDHYHRKEMQKSKMAVWGGLTNNCEKKRSEKQRRKGKI